MSIFVKSQNPEFHAMFGKRKTIEFLCLEKLTKAEIPMFGRDKTLNYIVWKRQNSEFQCLQK